MKKNVNTFFFTALFVCFFAGCNGCENSNASNVFGGGGVESFSTFTTQPLLSCSNGLTVHFKMPRTKTSGVNWDIDKTAPDAYGRLVITEADGIKHSESILKRIDQWHFEVNLYRGKQVTLNTGDKVKLTLDDHDPISDDDLIIHKTWKATGLIFKASRLTMKLVCRGQ